jgi:prepilin-type N-terminal cleavage/methylation domain-containing protein
MKEKGFTLIELLIVLALIAILAAVLIVVIKPGQIFSRARDTQRQGDLRNLSQAVDSYLTELAQNLNLAWPSRGGCTGSSSPNIFFSVTTTAAAPTGWPAMPTSPATHTATGTTNQATDGNGWVPLNFGLVSVLNLPQLPVDPRNNQASGGATLAYSFACDQANFNYEFAAKLEGSTSTMANDGGNENSCGGIASTTCLYEVGPGKVTLY